MRVYLGLAIAVVLGLAGTLRAEPLNLEQVAANAKWVAHVDVDAMWTSTVIQKTREQWMQIHPGAEVLLAGIREVWKFDPRTDLHDMTFYGEQLKKDTGVAIVHAKVDQQLLLEKAKNIPEHQVSAYGKYELYTWKHKHLKGPKHGRMMTGVFYKPDVIVFGSLDEVKAALDVLDGAKPNLAGKDSPLAAAVPPGAMFLARVVGLADADALPCKFPIIKQTESLALAVGEKEGESFFTGRMTVKNAELAKQMKVVVEGVRAMAVMVHGGDSKALEIIDALKVDVDGKVVEIECRAPAEKVWTFLKKMEENKKLRIDTELSLPETDDEE